MDETRFDELAKRMAHRGLSRRRLVAGVAGGSLGGLAALLGRQETDAFLCREPGVLCAKDAHCCSGTCVDDHCACPDAEQTVCGRTCVDLQTDAQNCGRCGQACASTEICQGGHCLVGASACAGLPDGTPCGASGAGLRCCHGTCPSPTCLSANSCCADGPTCLAQCCTQAGASGPQCASTYSCAVNVFGGMCGSDADCANGECICGTCCGNAGSECQVNTHCCSGKCQGGVVCA